ncbi:hypothetical protein Tco_0413798 [Tanacetum coccineum]
MQVCFLRFPDDSGFAALHVAARKKRAKIHKQLRFLLGKLAIKSADTTKKGNNMLSLNLLYTNVVPAKWSNNDVTKQEPHSIIHVLEDIILSNPKVISLWPAIWVVWILPPLAAGRVLFVLHFWSTTLLERNNGDS